MWVIARLVTVGSGLVIAAKRFAAERSEAQPAAKCGPLAQE